jgi:hypothetical protein
VSVNDALSRGSDVRILKRARMPDTVIRHTSSRHDRTFPRGLMNAIAQSVSAETACEILHKALPRKRRGSVGPHTFGSAPCSRHERAFSDWLLVYKNMRAGSRSPLPTA